MADLQLAFETAVANSKNLIDPPEGEAQLELYAWFRQGADGDCDEARPDAGDNDGLALAKWQAWKALAGTAQDEAKRQYITLISAVG